MKDSLRIYMYGAWNSLQRHAFALLLCAAYLIWLLQSARTLGFGRDESFYFDAASQYARWLEAFWKKPSFAMQTSVVDGNFGYNHEHPSLMKLLFGLSELLQWQRSVQTCGPELHPTQAALHDSPVYL